MSLVTPFRKLAELNALAESKNWPMRCDDALAFERQELRDLLALWRYKAADGIPARSAFDMRALKPYVPNILILEREGEGIDRRYRFRLFGSALLILFGEHTGRYLDDMVSPRMLPSWLAIYDAVLAARQPLRLVTHFLLPSRQYLRGEILTAPMTDAEGRENLVLAATYVGPKDAVHAPG